MMMIYDIRGYDDDDDDDDKNIIINGISNAHNHRNVKALCAT